MDKRNVIDLRIAKLPFRLDASESRIKLNTPPSHAKFLKNNPDKQEYFSYDQRKLHLQINNNLLKRQNLNISPIQCVEIWELWKDEAGNFIFVAPRQSPPQYISVDPVFTEGNVYSEYPSNNQQGIYPIFNDLEIVFFVNWLGTFGDILLHASGVILDGKGYAFIGTSGAGKSTLASTLAEEPAVTVLGEDQVILRLIDGQFCIYGTPWHLNPAMCSPQEVPLEKLFFLEKNGEYAAEPIKPSDGITRILQTAFIPYYRPELVAKILDHLITLAVKIPFRSLSYPLGSDVWKLINPD